jgi:glycerate 2-kinase
LRDHAGRILRAAVDAIEPSLLLERAYHRSALPRRTRATDTPDLLVVAAGKAAWPMARAFADLEGDAVRRGVIAGPRVSSARGGSRSVPHRFESFDAGHPSPNAASVAAGLRALELARESRHETIASGWLVVLLSGGASALLVAPVPEVTLEDKIATGRALMRAGVAIDGLNCVRKHLSQIKGGRLAAASARTITLAISDVHGPIPDDPSVIGSGPTVGDPTTFAQALAIVDRADEVPSAVRRYIARGARGELSETVKPEDVRLSRGIYEIIGNRQTAVEGAALAARALGYSVHVMPQAIVGEARDASLAFLRAARQAAANAGARPGAKYCVLAAGETTVTVTGNGLGGRNQEFVLAAVPEMASFDRPAVLASVGTDGIDGPTDAAGALVDSTTLERARLAGVDWESTLAGHDAYHFFQPLGDLMMWGPTGTNVGDVQMLLVA